MAIRGDSAELVFNTTCYPGLKDADKEEDEVRNVAATSEHSGDLQHTLRALAQLRLEQPAFASDNQQKICRGTSKADIPDSEASVSCGNENEETTFKKVSFVSDNNCRIHPVSVQQSAVANDIYYTRIYNFIVSEIYPDGLSLNNKKLLKRRSQNYCVIDGKLYYDRKQPRKVVVSKEQQKYLLQKFHLEESTGTHLDTKRFYDAISRLYFWRGLFVDVGNYVNNCKGCSEPAITDSTGITVKDASTGTEEQSYDNITKLHAQIRARVWEKVILKICGPYPRTVNGNQYIITLIDPVSKWICGKPITCTKDNKIIASFMIKMMCLYGFAECYAGGFTSQELKDINDYCVVGLYGLESIPYASGKRRRKLTVHKPFIKEGKDNCRWSMKLMDDFVNRNPSDWDQKIYLFLHAYHTTVGSDMLSPFYKMYGRLSTTLLEEDKSNKTGGGITSSIDAVKSTRKKLHNFLLQCRHCGQIFTSRISFHLHQRDHAEGALEGEEIQTSIDNDNGEITENVQQECTVNINSNILSQKACRIPALHQKKVKAYQKTVTKLQSKEIRAKIIASVKGLLESTRERRRKRGKYRKYPQEVREEIAHYAIKYGYVEAVRCFSEKLGTAVSDSTVRNIVKLYCSFTPEVRKEIGRYAVTHSVKAASEHFTQRLGYPVGLGVVYKFRRSYLNQLPVQEREEIKRKIYKRKNIFKPKNYYNDTLKEEIGHYAFKYNIGAAKQHYSKKLPRPITESVVRRFRKFYLQKVFEQQRQQREQQKRVLQQQLREKQAIRYQPKQEIQQSEHCLLQQNFIEGNTQNTERDTSLQTINILQSSMNILNDPQFSITSATFFNPSYETSVQPSSSMQFNENNNASVLSSQPINHCSNAVGSPSLPISYPQGQISNNNSVLISQNIPIQGYQHTELFSCFNEHEEQLQSGFMSILDSDCIPAFPLGVSFPKILHNSVSSSHIPTSTITLALPTSDTQQTNEQQQIDGSGIESSQQQFHCLAPHSTDLLCQQEEVAFVQQLIEQSSQMEVPPASNQFLSARTHTNTEEVVYTNSNLKDAANDNLNSTTFCTMNITISRDTECPENTIFLESNNTFPQSVKDNYFPHECRKYIESKTSVVHSVLPQHTACSSSLNYVISAVTMGAQTNKQKVPEIVCPKTRLPHLVSFVHSVEPKVSMITELPSTHQNLGAPCSELTYHTFSEMPVEGTISSETCKSKTPPAAINHISKASDSLPVSLAQSTESAISGLPQTTVFQQLTNCPTLSFETVSTIPTEANKAIQPAIICPVPKINLPLSVPTDNQTETLPYEVPQIVAPIQQSLCLTSSSSVLSTTSVGATIYSPARKSKVAKVIHPAQFKVLNSTLEVQQKEPTKCLTSPIPIKSLFHQKSSLSSVSNNTSSMLSILSKSKPSEMIYSASRAPVPYLLQQKQNITTVTSHALLSSKKPVSSALSNNEVSGMSVKNKVTSKTSELNAATASGHTSEKVVTPVIRSSKKTEVIVSVPASFNACAVPLTYVNSSVSLECKVSSQSDKEKQPIMASSFSKLSIPHLLPLVHSKEMATNVTTQVSLLIQQPSCSVFSNRGTTEVCREAEVSSSAGKQNPQTTDHLTTKVSTPCSVALTQQKETTASLAQCIPVLLVSSLSAACLRPSICSPSDISTTDRNILPLLNKPKSAVICPSSKTSIQTSIYLAKSSEPKILLAQNVPVSQVTSSVYLDHQKVTIPETVALSPQKNELKPPVAECPTSRENISLELSASVTPQIPVVSAEFTTSVIPNIQNISGTHLPDTHSKLNCSLNEVSPTVAADSTESTSMVNSSQISISGISKTQQFSNKTAPIYTSAISKTCTLSRTHPQCLKHGTLSQHPPLFIPEGSNFSTHCFKHDLCPISLQTRVTDPLVMPLEQRLPSLSQVTQLKPLEAVVTNPKINKCFDGKAIKELEINTHSFSDIVKSSELSLTALPSETVASEKTVKWLGLTKSAISEPVIPPETDVTAKTSSVTVPNCSTAATASSSVHSLSHCSLLSKEHPESETIQGCVNVATSSSKCSTVNKDIRSFHLASNALEGAPSVVDSRVKKLDNHSGLRNVSVATNNTENHSVVFHLPVSASDTGITDTFMQNVCTNVKVSEQKCPRKKCKNDDKSSQSQVSKGCKRGHYTVFSPEIRAEMAKYAVEHGVQEACIHFETLLGTEIAPSTIRGLREKYLLKLGKKMCKGKNNGPDVISLNYAQRGRPMKLGKYDEEVRQCIQEFTKSGERVSSYLVIETARQILLQYEPERLEENGGDVRLSTAWAKSFMRRIGMKHDV